MSLRAQNCHQNISTFIGVVFILTGSGSIDMLVFHQVAMTHTFQLTTRDWTAWESWDQMESSTSRTSMDLQ